MKKTIEVYYCDMCGKEIDTSADNQCRSIICSGYSSFFIPTHTHNPTYDEGYQDGISWERIDLCPECADRVCVIHQEWYEKDGKLLSKLSWRGERREVVE